MNFFVVTAILGIALVLLVDAYSDDPSDVKTDDGTWEDGRHNRVNREKVKKDPATCFNGEIAITAAKELLIGGDIVRRLRNKETSDCFKGNIAFLGTNSPRVGGNTGIEDQLTTFLHNLKYVYGSVRIDAASNIPAGALSNLEEIEAEEGLALEILRTTVDPFARLKRVSSLSCTKSMRIDQYTLSTLDRTRAEFEKAELAGRCATQTTQAPTTEMTTAEMLGTTEMIESTTGIPIAVALDDTHGGPSNIINNIVSGILILLLVVVIIVLSIMLIKAVNSLKEMRVGIVYRDNKGVKPANAEIAAWNEKHRRKNPIKLRLADAKIPPDATREDVVAYFTFLERNEMYLEMFKMVSQTLAIALDAWAVVSALDYGWSPEITKIHDDLQTVTFLHEIYRPLQKKMNEFRITDMVAIEHFYATSDIHKYMVHGVQYIVEGYISMLYKSRRSKATNNPVSVTCKGGRFPQEDERKKEEEKKKKTEEEKKKKKEEEKKKKKGAGKKEDGKKEAVKKEDGTKGAGTKEDAKKGAGSKEDAKKGDGSKEIPKK